METERRPPSLVLSLATAVAARTVINTARRLPYPFAPDLARHLGVPLAGITAMIAASQLAALLGPVAGPLADRRGPRVLLLAGMALTAAGMAAGVLDTYTAVFAGVLMASVGKAVFDPAVQAHVGARVALPARGRAVGLVETAWAGSTLVGIPVVGWVADRAGWPEAFGFLAGLGVLGIAGVAWAFPPAADPSRAGRRGNPAGVLREPRARAALAFGFLVSLANDNLFVVYGALLESRFGLGLAALGASTAVVGLAELSGEGLTAAVSDRIGLTRALGWGTALTAAAYLALPLSVRALPLALGALYGVFVCFEFTVVTSFSVCTEVAPGARATFLSLYFAVLGLGRMVGALIGAPVWAWGGIWATAGVSAGVTLLAGMVLSRSGLRLAPAARSG
ncbi:MFS transporter [Deferrisoma camini]|uniref:MFS transporter n=1 Tax=Deferrisoma camini TaxID=1035120 RepID=UPI00046CAAFE|nr:MFS transporter [Deferrisoma camini]